MTVKELKALIKETLLEAVPFDKATDIEHELRKKYDELEGYTFGVEFEFEPVSESEPLSRDNIASKLGEKFNSRDDGGFTDDRIQYQMSITGKDGKSWDLPLPFDDQLQPLYRGPPLPLCVLKAAEIKGDNGQVGVEGTSYEKADPEKMAEACRHMAGWKLAGNGQNVSKFAARGGPGKSAFVLFYHVNSCVQ